MTKLFLEHYHRNRDRALYDTASAVGVHPLPQRRGVSRAGRKGDTRHPRQPRHAAVSSARRRAADACSACGFQNRQTLGQKRTFFRSLHVHERTFSITNDGEQAFVIFDRDNDIDGFSHAARFTYLAERSVSVTH